MPRGRPVKYKSALAHYSIENILKRQGYDVHLNRNPKPIRAIPVKLKPKGKSDGRSHN